MVITASPDSICHQGQASSYAKAIAKALSGSRQIADKFHLVKNLGDYIYEEIQRQYHGIKGTFMASQKQESAGGREDNRPTVSIR